MKARSTGDLAAAPRNPRYPIRGLLGRGSMGVVYLARDLEMGRDVALKTFHEISPEEIYHLKREFRALADLSHPNLAQLYDLVVEDDHSFFTMELLHGRDLLSFAREVGSGTSERAGRLRAALLQLARGLHALHQRGKLHRDLKPGNAMVEPDGRTVLLDFGLVAAARAGGDEEDGFAGTLGYIAPEQLAGRPPSPASDWYGVGALLYECLTGSLPDRRRDAWPPDARERNPAADAELSALARALLRDDPRTRPDGAEVLGRLGRSDDGPEIDDVAFAPDGDEIFVGRRAEFDLLERALAGSRSGACVVVRIEGLSGIGKSALLERFCTRAARESGALILRSRCHPQESLRFKALDGAVDALSRFLLHRPPADLAALAPKDLAALLRVFPVLAQVPFPEPDSGAAPPGAEPQEIRRRAFTALRTLIEGVAYSLPTVLWIDDLQWGDLDSAPLLRALMRPPAAPPLLILLSHRSEEREASPLLADLDGTRGEAPLRPDHRLVLEPLEADEARELVDLRLASLGAERGARIDEIATESEGSPFFIEQLARSVRVQQGHADPAGRPRRLDLARVVNERVRALPEEARRLVELAAVAGAPLERSLLLRAAGLAESERTVVVSLRNHSMLSHTSVGGRAAVQPYHDRIRESVLSDLAPEATVAHHRSLALVLEASGRATPDALAHHFHGAGNLPRAAGYARTAGDRAAESLAFLRAAELYRQSLDWGHSEPVRDRELRSLRAAALACAGHGGEAAPLYLEAARGADANEADSLRLRAAEQFLVSGRVDEGLRVLRPMLARLGVPLPDGSVRAAAGLAVRLAQLAARGTRFRERRPESIPDRDLARIDACHAAVKGLVMVDPLPGAYMTVRSLLLALQSGEAVRIGRSLCVFGASMIPAGPPLSLWAERLLAVVRQLARDQQDPYLLGVASISTAQVSLMGARWSEMLEHCDAGVELLGDRGQTAAWERGIGTQGVAWERSIGRMGALRALEELGRVTEVSERAESLLHEALDRGDLYAQVTARLYLALCHLHRGDPADARAQARAALDLWARDGFLLQHLYAMRVEACCDLYEGRPREAWGRVRAAWPDIRRSGLLRHALLRTDALALRARTAAALAICSGASAPGLLRVAEGDARRLVREGRPDAVGAGRLVQAAVARTRGDAERSEQLLADAIERFQAAGMALHVEAARRRRVQWSGAGPEGETLATMDARIRERGVDDPARWLALIAPDAPREGGHRNNDATGVTPK